jgi:hypothetical protein
MPRRGRAGPAKRHNRGSSRCLLVAVLLTSATSSHG